MIKRIDHVAIVVKNIEETMALFSTLFGVKAGAVETMPAEGVKTALVAVGDTELEFLEPIDPQGGVAKFLERKGEGIHHVSFEVDDVDQELKSLAQKGVELIDKEGRKGLAGRIGFIHPKSTKGVLIELAQKVD